jgi:hypothetical protein
MSHPSRPKPRLTSSLELAVPFRVLRTSGGCTFHARPKPFVSSTTPFPGVSSPSASPRSEQRHNKKDRASQAPPACASRFSQPPDAFVSAPSLPAFFHAGSAPGVRPSELSSSRAAARRLRRRCPLVVRNLSEVVFSKSPPVCPSRNRDTRPTAPVQRSSTDPVAFRALLHTKVRHFPSAC